jgi:hypothetical protein
LVFHGIMGTLTTLADVHQIVERRLPAGGCLKSKDRVQNHRKQRRDCSCQPHNGHRLTIHPFAFLPFLGHRFKSPPPINWTERV